MWTCHCLRHALQNTHIQTPNKNIKRLFFCIFSFVDELLRKYYFNSGEFRFFFRIRFLFNPLFDSSYFYKKIKLSMVRSSFSQILLSFLLPMASMVSVCTVIFQFKFRFWKALYCSWVLIMRLFSHTVSRMEFLPSFARCRFRSQKRLIHPIQSIPSGLVCVIFIGCYLFGILSRCDVFFIGLEN